jgi:hypothetical protein
VTRENDDIHRPTVAAVAVVAYCLTNLVHEGLGHGGACLLVGGTPQLLNAIFFSCDEGSLGAGSQRVILAGGSVANLLFAAMAYGGLLLCRGRTGAAHYFLWLMLSLNVLMPFGYLMFSGLGGFGDWAGFIDGLGPPLPLRAVLAAVGALAYFWVAPRIIMPQLNLYLGRDPSRRAARARWLSLLPYLVGGATYVAAGLFNPGGVKLVLVSAAATSFGGTSLLAWFPGRADRDLRAGSPEEPAPLPRSVGWMVAATLAFLVFVGVLGPGVKL